MTALAHINPRFIYFLDALASLGLGALLAILAGPLAALAGWPLPVGILTGAGVFLLAWAAFNLWTGLARAIPRGVFAVHTLVDAAWVAGSLVLVAMTASSLTVLGFALLLAQAIAVLFVLALKVMGRGGLRAAA